MLTGRASFNDNLNLLMQYTISQAGFPRDILLEAGVSFGGADFVQCCMVPRPSSRLSATYAFETLRWIQDSPNAYEDLSAESMYILPFKSREELFILLTPDNKKLVVIATRRICL